MFARNAKSENCKHAYPFLLHCRDANQILCQDDMNRTEELTTKIRTLSYDHERLLSMYRDTTERAANAEREMNLHKSRLA